MLGMGPPLASPANLSKASLPRCLADGASLRMSAPVLCSPQLERQVKMDEMSGVLKLIAADPLKIAPSSEEFDAYLVAKVFCTGSCDLPPEAAAPWRWAERWTPVLNAGQSLGNAPNHASTRGMPCSLLRSLLAAPFAPCMRTNPHRGLIKG